MHAGKLEKLQRQRNDGQRQQLHHGGKQELGLFAGAGIVAEHQHIGFKQHYHDEGKCQHRPQQDGQCILYVFHFASNSVLFNMERPKVTSSVYSSSSPTLTPRAMTVMRNCW